MLVLLLSLVSAYAGVRGSSELADDSGKHPASYAFDGLLKTGWGEGAAGAGEGSWLELDLGRATDLRSVSIWPGDLSQGAKSYREHSRPRLVQLYVDGEAVGDPVSMEDKARRYDVALPAGVRGRKLKVEVKEVYEGMVFPDLFISEIAVNFPDTSDLGKLANWMKSKDAEKQQVAFEADVEARYQTYKAAQFGDSDAMDWLGDAVADGAPYLRDRVRTLVPDGYRAQAIVSDPTAQEAARKLKDPNVIPSFLLAQLRASGDEARKLQDVVEIFEATAELIGGGNRNVPYWGQPGWEPGALRGFGEPLDMDMDRAGNVFIADVGNNRVQQFAENGRPVRQIGPKADITDAWFAGGRKWYVSGAAPGEGAGQFFNPLAVAVIPGKDGEQLATLDARGRVQIFDADGKPVISWKVATRDKPEPNLGGTAFLVWVPQKDRLYVIIQNEAVAYNLNAEELARFEIKDGTPKAAVASGDGKLLLAFGYEVVGYDPDGFRYGTVIESGVLGRGYEDLDLVLDNEGKLWAITDIGEVFKFKKPGKVEFQVLAVTRPIRRPRMVVKDGIVYFASDDRVEVVDAYQLHLDAVAEEAEKNAQQGKGKGKSKGKKGGD